MFILSSMFLFRGFLSNYLYYIIAPILCPRYIYFGEHQSVPRISCFVMLPALAGRQRDHFYIVCLSVCSFSPSCFHLLMYIVRSHLYLWNTLSLLLKSYYFKSTFRVVPHFSSPEHKVVIAFCPAFIVRRPHLLVNTLEATFCIQSS